MLTACSSPSPQQQVEQVLIRREQALANKDLAAYMALISPRYSDRGKTYRDIQKEAEQNFAAFSRIELSTSKRAIYLEGEQATGTPVFVMPGCSSKEEQAVVVQEYILSYWLPSGRQSVKDKERLVLQQEGDGWKIIKGL